MAAWEIFSIDYIFKLFRIIPRLLMSSIDQKVCATRDTLLNRPGRLIVFFGFLYFKHSSDHVMELFVT